MGIITNEKSFPRGGNEPAILLPRKGLFDFEEKQKHKKKKKEKELNIPKKSSKTKKKVVERAELLSRKMVFENMLILGCICEIEEYEIIVSLPGRLMGYIPIYNISTPYTNLLHNLVEDYSNIKNVPKLEDMFCIGQSVVAKVMEMDHKVMLSIAPQDVQSKLSHYSLKEDMVIVAAVSGIEENVYTMDTGIKNVRAFLKKSSTNMFKKTWNKDKDLEIGQWVRCVVVESDVSSSVTTVQLSARPKKIRDAVLDCSEILIDMFPGSLVDVTVSKILRNGLQVSIGKNFVGYVHEEYLSTERNSLQDYAVDDVVPARVLYIQPIKNDIFLTLKTEICGKSPNHTSPDCRIGEVFEEAEVLYSNQFYGVLIKISEGIDTRGYVPRRECNIEDFKKIEEEFPMGSKHICKVINYDYFSQMFICSFDSAIIKSDYLSPKEMPVGLKMKCTIKEHVSAGAVVTVENIGRPFTALVQPHHLGDGPSISPETDFPVGTKCKARLLEVDNSRIHLTLKKSFVKSKADPLQRIEDLKVGMNCEGVVVLIRENGLMVTFYGNLKGWVQFNSEVIKKYKMKPFYLGQVVECCVMNISQHKKTVTLKLKEEAENVTEEQLNKIKYAYYEIGKKYSVTITKVGQNHLEVMCAAGYGTIHEQHLTDNPSLASHLLKTYSVGDVLDNVYCSRYAPTVLTLKPLFIDYFENGGYIHLEELSPFSVLPCEVDTIRHDGVYLRFPLKNCMTTFVKHKDMYAGKQDGKYVDPLPHQGFIALVVQIDKCKRRLSVNLNQENIIKRLDYLTEHRLSMMRHYWLDYDRIMDHMKKENGDYAEIKPGASVKGIVKDIKISRMSILLDQGVEGIVRAGLFDEEHMKRKKKINATVIHVDPYNGLVDLVCKDSIVNTIDSNQGKEEMGNSYAGKKMDGQVVVTNDDVIIIVLMPNSNDNDINNRNQLGYIPKQVFYNDYDTVRNRSLKIGDIVEVQVQLMVLGRIICHLIEIKQKMTKHKNSNTSFKSLDMSFVNGENSYHEVDTSDVTKSGGEDTRKKKRKTGDIEINESEIDVSKSKKRSFNSNDLDEDKSSTKRTRMSSHEDGAQLSCLGLDTGFVWNAKPSLLPAVAGVNKSDSSSDEEEEDQNSKKHNRTTKKAMRKSEARLQEQALRETERLLADHEAGPQSVHDFERLVLSSPNSSLCWIKFMSFELQATEIEKARAIGRRALSTISFREEEEKFNVWVALLNLENLYGTKEELEKLIEEALRMNDAYKIYIQIMRIFGDSKKTEEAEKIVKVFTKKFKDNKLAWTEAGEVLMKLGKLDSARALMQRALKHLDKKQHVEVIVKYAHLETQLGEPERAQTLMEFILTSYPKRTDVWSSYVDLLVKNNQLDAARQVLERGIAQRLSARKMKTLYSKYLQFEERHGTPEGVENVKSMAKKYVESSVRPDDE